MDAARPDTEYDVAPIRVSLPSILAKNADGVVERVMLELVAEMRKGTDPEEGMEPLGRTCIDDDGSTTPGPVGYQTEYVPFQNA